MHSGRDSVLEEGDRRMVYEVVYEGKGWCMGRMVHGGLGKGWCMNGV